MDNFLRSPHRVLNARKQYITDHPWFYPVTIWLIIIFTAAFWYVVGSLAARAFEAFIRVFG